MRVIYKYPIHENIEIELPADAQILSAQLQYGEPVLWILLDPSTPKTKRHIIGVGTGHQVPDNSNYIGTFQLNDGDFVIHLFEIKQR